MRGREVIDADREPERGVGVEAQLNPVAVVVRVYAADFDRPFPVRSVDDGAVEVDKKLVGVGNSGRNGSCEADFANHESERCKFGASKRHEKAAIEPIRGVSFNRSSM